MWHTFFQTPYHPVPTLLRFSLCFTFVTIHMLIICSVREANVYDVCIGIFIFRRLSKVIIKVFPTYTNHAATEHENNQFPFFHLVNHILSKQKWQSFVRITIFAHFLFNFFDHIINCLIC